MYQVWISLIRKQKGRVYICTQLDLIEGKGRRHEGAGGGKGKEEEGKEKETATSEELAREIKLWINLQTEASLQQASVKTIRRNLLVKFAMETFTKEQKTFIKDTTVQYLQIRTKEIAEKEELEARLAIRCWRIYTLYTVV